MDDPFAGVAQQEADPFTKVRKLNARERYDRYRKHQADVIAAEKAQVEKEYSAMAADWQKRFPMQPFDAKTQNVLRRAAMKKIEQSRRRQTGGYVTAGDPGNIVNKPMTEARLDQSSIQTQVGLNKNIDENQARVNLARSRTTPGQTISGEGAKLGADEWMKRGGAAIKPVVAPVIEAGLGASGAGAALKAVRPDVYEGINKSASEMASQGLAGAAFAPLAIGAEFAQLSDPRVELVDKIGAATNLAIIAVLGDMPGGNPLGVGAMKTVKELASRARVADWMGIDRILTKYTKDGRKRAEMIDKMRQSARAYMENPASAAGPRMTQEAPSALPAPRQKELPASGQKALNPPNRTAIDVTQEVANRPALTARTETPGFEPSPIEGYMGGASPEIAKEAFITRSWRDRTQGLINDLQQLIDTQSGAGRRLGPLRRELQKSMTSGVPHPSIRAELEDVWKANQTPVRTPGPTAGIMKARKSTKVAQGTVEAPKTTTVNPEPETTIAAGAVPETNPPKTTEVPNEAKVQNEGQGKAPEVVPATPKPVSSIIPAGSKKSKATTPDLKQTVGTEERLVELDDLGVSHDLTGKENPNFPQDLQNRDRGRAGALDQADERARNLDPSAIIDDFLSTDRGSPIIDAAGNVISGNGRAMSLRMAKERYGAKWEAYRKALIEKYPEAATMKNPVLVRRVVDELDDAGWKNLAEKSNQTSVARLSPMEEAVSDAKRIPDDFADRFSMRGKSISEALASPANRGLVQSIINDIPDNEKIAMLDGAGGVSDLGRDRIARALLFKIFGDDAARILETHFEQGDFAKRIMGGLEQAAGNLADLTKPGNDIAAEMKAKIVKALEFIDEAKKQRKMSMTEWFNQGSLDARDPGAMKIAKGLVDAKSKEQVADIVSLLARAGDDSSGGMFADELGFKTADEAIDSAFEGAKSIEDSAIGLFDSVGAFNEANKPFGGGMGGDLRRGAVRHPIEGIIETGAGVKDALGRTGIGQLANSIKRSFQSAFGNAFDTIRAGGGEGKRIAQDVERILSDSAAMTANYGMRIKAAIQANFGRVPGLTRSSSSSLGLADDFNDIVSKVERGEKLTGPEKKVWAVWVDINTELARVGESRGVLIERTVGEADFKDMVGRVVHFRKDGVDLKGVVEKTNGGMLVRTAEGRVNLKYGDKFWTGSLANPETFFPRELKPGILDELAKSGSDINKRAAEYLLEKQYARNAAEADKIIARMLTPLDVVVDSPVKSRLRRARLGDLLPPEFYNRNFAEVAEKHIARAAIDIATANTWGGDYSRFAELLKTMQPAEHERVRAAVEAGLGMNKSKPESRAIALEGSYQAVSKLSGLQTAAIQLSQFASNAGILGVKAAAQGSWEVIKGFRHGLDEINRIRLAGVIDEDILSLHGFDDLRGAVRSASNFALSPMKLIDRIGRYPAAKAGLVAVQDLAKKIKFDIAYEGGRATKTIHQNAAYRALSEWFSFTDEDIVRMANSGMNDSDKILAMRGGVKTQITTRAADVPMHVNEVPALRMLWRFKTFAYGQARLFSWAAKEASHGNFAPIVRLAAASAVIGEGVLGVKEKVLEFMTGEESKRPTLAETAEKGWEALALRAWSNIVETGTFGLYKDVYDKVDPDAPAYKKQLSAPVLNTFGNILDAAAYGAKTEGEFLQKIEAAVGDLSNKEIVVVKQFYKRAHEGKTYRQVNPAPPKDEEGD